MVLYRINFRIFRPLAISMIKLISSLYIAFSSMYAICQYTSPQVTAASGGTGSSASATLQWTLGEPVIQTALGTSAQLTCGFHQTDAFCFGDFNFDGQIDTNDVLILLGEWGCVGVCLADMDQDGEVGTTDILLLLGTFGTSCYAEL